MSNGNQHAVRSTALLLTRNEKKRPRHPATMHLIPQKTTQELSLYDRCLSIRGGIHTPHTAHWRMGDTRHPHQRMLAAY